MDDEKLLPTRAVMRRYDIVDRTVARWIEAGILPEPIRIRGRKYWPESALVKLERSSVKRASSTNEETATI
jgi:hypothetical protein